MAVRFQDFSFDVKAALDDTTIAWLHTWASEIASHAARNCKLDDDAGKQLKGSYNGVVNEGKGEARIGSPLEQAYWEEWGTGEHAAHKDGRKGWWVYVKGQAPQGGGTTYHSREEAEAVAASMRADGLDAYATNGREPNYTLERAFDANRQKAIADLEAQLGRRLGK